MDPKERIVEIINEMIKLVINSCGFEENDQHLFPLCLESRLGSAYKWLRLMNDFKDSSFKERKYYKVSKGKVVEINESKSDICFLKYFALPKHVYTGMYDFHLLAIWLFTKYPHKDFCLNVIKLEQLLYEILQISESNDLNIY